MAQLGFVGLGEMGSRIAIRLLRAGHTLTVYNRTRAKAGPLLAMGMRWADSPRVVAEQSDVTFSMIADTLALQAVTQGDGGLLMGLGPGKVYVDMSTVSPQAIRELGAQVAARSAQMLDAPISGGPGYIEQGKGSLMVAGDRATFELLLPVLTEIGPTVTYVGESGQAASLKLAINLSLGVQMLAFCESVVLAEKAGISRETAVEVLLKSVAASPMLTYRGPMVLNMPERAWFTSAMMQKDMLLALELGRSLAVPLPTTAVMNEMLTAARGMGYANEDFASLFDALARMAGMQVTR
jgi:3-hydroxyisobutyrate dehydrogenase-like beta-hydroxyacid dehydrogenase